MNVRIKTFNFAYIDNDRDEQSHLNDIFEFTDLKVI